MAVSIKFVFTLAKYLAVKTCYTLIPASNLFTQVPVTANQKKNLHFGWFDYCPSSCYSHVETSPQQTVFYFHSVVRNFKIALVQGASSFLFAL